MDENEKIIDLLYKINYFPSLKKLITIVHKSNPQITEHEIKNITKITLPRNSLSHNRKPNQQDTLQHW